MRTADAELQILRLSLRRVAEAANRQGATLIIPDLRIPPRIERGWNSLASDLIGWIEELEHQSMRAKM